MRTDAIVEGVVDAAFETDAGWVVVDFKTDADPGEALEGYLGQVRLYARAIATATSRPPPASSSGSDCLAAGLSRPAAGRPLARSAAVCRHAFARRPDDGSGLRPRHGVTRRWARRGASRGAAGHA